MSDKPALYTDTLARFAGLIHTIRGQRVILDRDAAPLLGTTLPALRAALTRNRDRLSFNNALRLTKEECAALGITRRSHSAWGPYALTDQGLTMAAFACTGELAARISIDIVRTACRPLENRPPVHDPQLAAFLGAVDALSAIVHRSTP